MQRFLLFAILCIPLALRLFFYYSERHIYEPGDTFVTEYTFLKEPKANAISQYFFTDNVLVLLPLFPKFEYGDRVLLEGVVELSKDGELLIVENPRVTKGKKMSPFLAVTRFVRQQVSQSVFAVLPGKEAGLLLGIVLGVRDRIPEGYYEQLRMVGVLHVVAASGANISILAGFLLPLLQRMVRQRVAILFTASVIIFYALLAGFDPPIVRASVMALLSYTVLLMGKKAASVVVLLLSAWVMLMVSPQLVADISFQLSFAATSGILLIKPLLDHVIRFRSVSIIKDDITTTLAAQATTMPILLGAFGVFPLISFPVNLLILWTVPFIMALSGIGSLIALISPFLSYPFFLLCYPFLHYFRFVVELGSTQTWSISLTHLPLALIIGYYLLLLAVFVKGGNK